MRIWIGNATWEMGIKILSTWKIGSDRGPSAAIYDTMTDFGMDRK